VRESWSLPGGYGDTRIIALVRDPRCIHAYWEVAPARIREVRQRLGEGVWASARSVLRVHDVTGIVFDGLNSHSFRDVELTGGAGSWYLDVGIPDRSWCVEIGIRTADGRFFLLARSNIVTTPRDSVSPVLDEEWMVQDEVFEKLAGVAGGLKPGASTDLSKAMRARLMDSLSSGRWSSATSPTRPRRP
jgi:hypothetical protein